MENGLLDLDAIWGGRLAVSEDEAGSLEFGLAIAPRQGAYLGGCGASHCNYWGVGIFVRKCVN